MQEGRKACGPRREIREKARGKNEKNGGRMFEKSKWIWAQEAQKRDQFVRFKTEFTVSGEGKSALLQIAAETKYYMYLNGDRV